MSQTLFVEVFRSYNNLQKSQKCDLSHNNVVQTQFDTADFTRK